MTTFTPTPIALLFVCSALVIGLLAIYISNNPRTSVSDPMTRTLLYVLCAALLWTGPYALHIIAENPTLKLFWFNLTMLGASLLVPAFVLHFATYADYHEWFTRPRRGLLAIEPTITAVLIATERYHALLRTDVELIVVAGTTVIHRGIGPWWFIRSTYLYLLMLVVFLILGISLWQASRLVRRQVAAATIAVAIPVTVNVMFDVQFLGTPPVLDTLAQVELTSVALGITAIILSYSVVRYGYVDLAFGGRRVAIDHIRDPYIVVDSGHRIIDYNPIFRPLVEAETPMFGENIREYVPEITAMLSAESRTHEEVLLERRDRRWFEVQLVPVGGGEGPLWRDQLRFRVSDDPPREYTTSERNEIAGYVLVFRDITARKRRERVLAAQNEQLELLNRIVSHDIHNEMDLTLGLIRRVRTRLEATSPTANEPTQVATEVPEYLAQVIESSNRVVDLTETARDLVEALAELDKELEPTPLKPILEREMLNAMSRESVVVDVRGEIPDVSVRANELLQSVFRNLLTNAVVHNDKPEPRITVFANETAETVRIEIADNGPGIPVEIRRTLFEKEVTIGPGPGWGSGLYLVRTLADQYEAELTVTENEFGGTTFVVELHTLAP